MEGSDNANINFGPGNQGLQFGVNHGPVDAHFHTHSERPETPPVPLSTVPFPRDQDYVHRDITKEVHEKLSIPAARIALSGLGGSGKTQLAIEYAYELRERSPTTWVLWLHASKAPRLERDVRNLLDHLKVSGRGNVNIDAFKLLSSWLRDPKNGKWLMILDNVDVADVLLEPASATGDLPASQVRRMDYLPVCDHGSYLSTSRSRATAQQIVEHRSMIRVDSMNSQEASQLLRQKLAGPITDDDAANLMKALDFLPLALAQATAYINRRMPRCSVQDYLVKLQGSYKSQIKLLERDEGDLRRDRDASNSAIMTWQFSFEHIRSLRSSAADLLSLMSFFDRQAIRDSLLKARDYQFCNSDDLPDGVEHENPWTNKLKKERSMTAIVEGTDQDNTSTDESEDLEEDIVLLRDFSLISVTKDKHVFTMHRLVQKVTKHWLSEQSTQLERWKSQFISNLYDECPNDTLLERYWPKCEDIYPHVRLAMDAKLVFRRPRLLQADLMRFFADYSLSRGARDMAEKMARISLELLECTICLSSERVCATMLIVADTASIRSMLSEAEDIVERALERRLRDYASQPNDPMVIRCRLRLADVYRHQSRFSDAETVLLRLLDGCRESNDMLDPHLVDCTMELADLYSIQGLHEPAMELLERRPKSMVDALATNVSALVHTADIYNRAGWIREAETLYLLAVAEQQQQYGIAHIVTLITMLGLAKLYHEQSRWRESEELANDVLNVAWAISGKDHPQAVRASQFLVSIYSEQHRWDEAEMILNQPLGYEETWRQAQLAKMLRARGRAAQSEV